MGFLTAFGTGVATGVINEQNHRRDAREEAAKAAMDRLNATIERRERELEDRAKVEQQAGMIARSRGLDPAAVRAALQAGRNPDDLLSGQDSLGRTGAGPAPVAGASPPPNTGATPAALGTPPAAGSGITRISTGAPVTPPANMYGRNAGRLPEYEAALAGGPAALADRSTRLASASGLPELPGGYRRALGSMEGVAGAGTGLPPAAGVIPRPVAAALPPMSTTTTARAPQPPQQFPEEAYSDPVLAAHRASAANPPPGPVARGVMDMIFGQRPEHADIDGRAMEATARARGMSVDQVRAARQPLPRDQMPQGYSLSRLPYDQSKLLSDPAHFDRGADWAAAAGTQAPAGLLGGGDRLRIQNDGRLQAAEARSEAAARAAGSKPVPVGYYNAGRVALSSMLGGNGPLQSVPDPTQPGMFRLMPSMASNRPEYREHLARIAEMYAKTDAYIERGMTPAVAARQAAIDSSYLAAPAAPTGTGQPAPAPAQRAPGGAQAAPHEGQTATNRQTGERMVFRNGQWAPMNAR